MELKSFPSRIGYVGVVLRRKDNATTHFARAMQELKEAQALSALCYGESPAATEAPGPTPGKFANY